MLQHTTCSSQTDIQSPYHSQTDISIDLHTGWHENAPQADMGIQENNTRFIKYMFLPHVCLRVPRNVNLISNCFKVSVLYISVFFCTNLLKRHISIPAISLITFSLHDKYKCQ
jgi:hypothetical protein